MNTALKRSLEFIWRDAYGETISRTYSNVNPEITDTTILKTLAWKIDDLSTASLQEVHIINTENLDLTEE